MQPKEGASVHCISFILSNPALQPELGRNSRQQQVPGCSSSHFSSFVGSLSARPKILTVPLSSRPVPSPGSSFPHEHPQLLLFSPFSFSQYFLSIPLSPPPSPSLGDHWPSGPVLLPADLPIPFIASTSKALSPSLPVAD